jgi:hypothetical protein
MIFIGSQAGDHMSVELNPDQLDTVRAYSAGQLGTRQAIDRAGMHDYADLVIALAQTGLDFPKPEQTPAHEANVARASAILQPRLRRGF